MIAEKFIQNPNKTHIYLNSSELAPFECTLTLQDLHYMRPFNFSQPTYILYRTGTHHTRHMHDTVKLILVIHRALLYCFAPRHNERTPST